MSFGYVNPITGFTYEVWFKTNSQTVNYRTLFNSRTQAYVTWNVGSSTAGIGRQLTIGIAGSGAAIPNVINFAIYSETGTTAVLGATWSDPGGGTYASDNVWHHFAFRLLNNRSTWTAFMDGAVLGTGNTTTAITWKPSRQVIGAEYAPHLGDQGSNLWNKYLAYPALYEKALSDNRIFEHYTAGAGGTVYYGDDEVTRLHRIGDWADLPSQSREFDSSLISLQGIQVAETNALTAMQDTVGAGFGRLFADGQSRMVYHNRRHSYNRWSMATLAESVGAAPEVGITFTVDDNNIFNDIRGDRPFGSELRVVDSFSKAAYGRKTFSFSLPVTTHEELRQAVSWIASQYREPSVRVSSVSFAAESSTLIEWVGTGGVNIGDVITLDELPVDAAPDAKMSFVVEKVSVDANIIDKTWRVDLQLSPYELVQVFQVGKTPLGSRYKIAY